MSMESDESKPGVQHGQRQQAVQRALDRASSAFKSQSWDVAEAEAEAAVRLIRASKEYGQSRDG